MADTDYDFDHHLEEVKENLSKSKGRTGTTENPGNKGTTGRTQYPFSVRLDQEYVDIIKALAWWKRISQREFIEQAVGQYLDDIDSEELKNILTQYHKNN